MKEVYKDIINLWIRVFGDDENFIISFLDRFFSEDNAVLRYNDIGELIGMAFLPIFKSADDLKIGYLYAVAVDERYRRKGIASEMIISLFDTEKCDVIATIPASESLRSWYGDSFGFVYPEMEITVINNLDFDLGTGNKDDDIFMVRIINACGYLSAYAKLHNKMNCEICLDDNIIMVNSGRYIVKNGAVTKKNIGSGENNDEINLIINKFKLHL